MVALLQRVRSAAVDCGNDRIAQIGIGLLILLGVGQSDNREIAQALARKTTALRIFPDPTGKLGRSVIEIGGEILVVPQFTLYADTSKGNRPSFARAAPPGLAEQLYECYVEELAKILSDRVQTGKFGADMQVSLVNDGPVTIWLEI
ncbi:MAG: D-aminoacyl-tRNA deacylase [Turneriella sp.]|nr:D-aminoacyl-tRNA deacylase [Turneriella sp.]